MPAVYGKEGLYWVNGISHLAGIAMIQTCLESLLPIKCPIDILSRSLPHPVVLERKTIGHNLNRNHNLAKSQWLEHLAHAEVCHKHLEQLGLRKRKLFDCLQNIFVLRLLLLNEWTAKQSCCTPFGWLWLFVFVLVFVQCPKPVWGSSPGRPGTRRAPCQWAATWSNDPRKGISREASEKKMNSWKLEMWQRLNRDTVDNYTLITNPSLLGSCC